MADLIVTGNLASAPVLRQTASGKAVANFRVMESRRHPDGVGGWIDDEPLALSCVAWQGLAENMVGLSTGDRVTVAGRLVPSNWMDDTGTKRYAVELVAEEVAVSLRFARVDGIVRIRPATPVAAGGSPF